MLKAYSEVASDTRDPAASLKPEEIAFLASLGSAFRSWGATAP